jgi:hypothetical protein
MTCSECPDPVYRRKMCRTHFLERYRVKPEPPKRTDPLVVYAWFAPDGTCEYVGRGTAARPMKHRFSGWWTERHRLETQECAHEWQAMMLEGEWIGRHLPLRNIEGYRPDGRAEVVRKMGQA